MYSAVSNARATLMESLSKAKSTYFSRSSSQPVVNEESVSSKDEPDTASVGKLSAKETTADQALVLPSPKPKSDRGSITSGVDDAKFDGDDLYEDFPSRRSMSDAGSKEEDKVSRRQSSSIQMLSSTEEETNWKKPWQTKQREDIVKHDEVSNISHDDTHSHISNTKIEPVKVESKPPPSFSSQASSELFESKEALKQMGLYKSVVPDEMDKMSCSSNGSSSVGFFSSNARVMEALAKDTDDVNEQEKTPPSSHHSYDDHDNEAVEKESSRHSVMEVVEEDDSRISRCIKEVDKRLEC